MLGVSQRTKESCYHSITNAFWLIFLSKVYCEACCGGAKKWDAMFFVSIPTIKYYHTYLMIAKKFASPIKQGTRQKHTRQREEDRILSLSSSSETPVQSTQPLPPQPSTPPPSYVTTTGEQLLGQVIKKCMNYLIYVDDDELLMMVSMIMCQTLEAILLCTQLFLLVLNIWKQKMSMCSQDSKKCYRIEDIWDDDKLYTFILDLQVFQAFFEFLGPAV